jgi:chromate transporter
MSHIGFVPEPGPAPPIRPTVARVTLYFLKLGAAGFGGPVALVGAMQRTLVDERRWLTRDDYVEGLAMAQLAPGPLAAQLAMYVGYVTGGVAGATAGGVAFVLPSFLIVWLLAALYVRFGGLWWMQAVFYGVGAAVIGVIARAVITLARTTLGADRLLWTIASLLAISTAMTGRENVWLFVFSGFLPLVARRWPQLSLAAVVPLAAPSPVAAASVSLASIAWFFTTAGAFVFGSGLAIVPFLYGGVVQERHWLTERQFADAVAVAMITPGPVVIAVAFIGYLVRGVPGMIVAALGVFVPVYLMVVAAAPWFRRCHDRPAVRPFVSGVTAAATGAIAGASMLLGRRALVDPATIGIAVVTLIALVRWRVSELPLIAAAAIAGLCLH